MKFALSCSVGGSEVAVEAVGYLSYRRLYDGLMMGGNDVHVNRYVPGSLGEEETMHWLVQEKVGALRCSIEVAELASHSV